MQMRKLPTFQTDQFPEQIKENVFKSPERVESSNIVPQTSSQLPPKQRKI